MGRRILRHRRKAGCPILPDHPHIRSPEHYVDDAKLIIEGVNKLLPRSLSALFAGRWIKSGSWKPQKMRRKGRLEAGLPSATAGASLPAPAIGPKYPTFANEGTVGSKAEMASGNSIARTTPETGNSAHDRE